MRRLVWLVLLVVGLSGCSGLPLARSTAANTPVLLTTSTPFVLPTATPAATTVSPSALAPIAPSSATPLAPTIALPPLSTPTISPTAGLVVRPTPTLATLSESERATIFDDVWQTVADHYLYQDFRGVDWQASKQQYRPQALAAPTPKAFYAVLGTMIDQLRDDHSRFISPQDAQQEDTLADGQETYVGIGVITKPVEELVVITTVFPGSPAAEAGLQRRDRLLTVDGETSGALANGLRGPEGSVVELLVQTPDGPTRKVAVTRRALNARYLPLAYRLPERNVGYLVIQSLWAESMATDVRDALIGLLNGPPLQGLIIDLRGNGGGWRTVLEGVLANFTSGPVGSFYSQNEDYALDIKSNDVYPMLQAVPLVVLVDQQTESYAEVLAAGLQAVGRAQVVGVATPGNTETIYAYDFADGSRLWIAQEGFKLPNGTNLEGRGVQPDAVVDVVWRRYSEQADPQIQQALALIAAAEPSKP